MLTIITRYVLIVLASVSPYLDVINVLGNVCRPPPLTHEPVFSPSTCHGRTSLRSSNTNQIFYTKAKRDKYVMLVKRGVLTRRQLAQKSHTLVSVRNVQMVNC